MHCKANFCSYFYFFFAVKTFNDYHLPKAYQKKNYNGFSPTLNVGNYKMNCNINISLSTQTIKKLNPWVYKCAFNGNCKVMCIKFDVFI